MVSPDVVRKRLRLLEGYLKKLRGIRSKTDLKTFLSDSDTQDIVDRNLHLAIEAVFDIGQAHHREFRVETGRGICRYL